MFTTTLLWMLVTGVAGVTGLSNVAGPPVHGDLLPGGIQQVSVLNVRSLLDLPFFSSPDSKVVLLHPQGFAPQPPPSQSPNQIPAASPSSPVSSPHVTSALLVASNVPSHVTSGLQPHVPSTASSTVSPNVLSDAAIPVPSEPLPALQSQPQAPVPNALIPTPVNPEIPIHTTARTSLNPSTLSSNAFALSQPVPVASQPSISVSESPAAAASQPFASTPSPLSSTPQPPPSAPHAMPTTSQSSLASVPSQTPNSVLQDQSSTPDATVSLSPRLPSIPQIPASASVASSTLEQSPSTSHQQNDVLLNSLTEAQPSPPDRSLFLPLNTLTHEINFTHQPVIPTPQLVSSTSLSSLSSPQPSHLPSSSQVALSPVSTTTPTSTDLSVPPEGASNRLLQVSADQTMNTLSSETALPPSSEDLEVAQNQTSSLAAGQPSPPQDPLSPVNSEIPPVSPSIVSPTPTVQDNEVHKMADGPVTRHPVRLIMPGAEEVTARRLATQARRASKHRSTTAETTSSPSPDVSQGTTPTIFSLSTTPTITPPDTTILSTLPVTITSTASAATTPPSISAAPPTANAPQALPAVPQQEAAPPSASAAGRLTALDPLTSLFLSVSRAAVQNVESAAFSHVNKPVTGGTPEVS